MSAPLISALVILMVLATIVVIASIRRADTKEAIGALSRETRQSDAGHRRVEGAATPSGREIELDARRAHSTTIVASPSAPPTEWRPPDPDALGATRRQFLNRSIVGFFAIGLSGFGAAAIAFLWPKLGGGFGSEIRVGNVSELIQEVRDNNGFL